MDAISLSVLFVGWSLLCVKGKFLSPADHEDTVADILWDIARLEDDPQQSPSSRQVKPRLHQDVADVLFELDKADHSVQSTLPSDVSAASSQQAGPLVTTKDAPDKRNLQQHLEQEVAAVLDEMSIHPEVAAVAADLEGVSRNTAASPGQLREAAALPASVASTSDVVTAPMPASKPLEHSDEHLTPELPQKNGSFEEKAALLSDDKRAEPPLTSNVVPASDLLNALEMTRKARSNVSHIVVDDASKSHSTEVVPRDVSHIVRVEASPRSSNQPASGSAELAAHLDDDIAHSGASLAEHSAGEVARKKQNNEAGMFQTSSSKPELDHSSYPIGSAEKPSKEAIAADRVAITALSSTNHATGIGPLHLDADGPPRISDSAEVSSRTAEHKGTQTSALIQDEVIVQSTEKKLASANLNPPQSETPFRDASSKGSHTARQRQVSQPLATTRSTPKVEAVTSGEHGAKQMAAEMQTASMINTFTADDAEALHHFADWVREFEDATVHNPQKVPEVLGHIPADGSDMLAKLDSSKREEREKSPSAISDEHTAPAKQTPTPVDDTTAKLKQKAHELIDQVKTETQHIASEVKKSATFIQQDSVAREIKLHQLEDQKAKAVAIEDYDLAKQLKADIQALRHTSFVSSTSAMS